MELWPEKQEDGTVIDWSFAEIVFNRLYQLDTVIFDFHKTSYYSSNIWRVPVDSIVRAFNHCTPSLAARGIFQLRVNTTLINLSDGVRIHDEEGTLCDELRCWEASGETELVWGSDLYDEH